MKILNNTDKEFCECLGTEYTANSSWGRAYCIISSSGKCCAKADIGRNASYHSKKALLENPDTCLKCGGHIYTIVEHP